MLRRTAILGALSALPLAAMPLAAQAQTQAPEAFLKAIYEPYKNDKFKGQPYWETARFFVPDLAQAIDRDMAESKKRKEPPTLDGDPFVDAQDWKIEATRYACPDVPGDRATCVVSFKNIGEAKALAVYMVRGPQGWRIDDIVGRGGSSLRALYKLK